MQPFLLPILLFILAATLLAAGVLAVGGLLGPRRSGAVKQMPYESGMDPIHDTRRRFDVRFYLVAIAFLVFDVELLFLYPWAIANQTFADSDLGRLVFFEIVVFVVLLGAGFAYAWRKGVFRWR